jgi:hypothetical protein
MCLAMITQPLAVRSELQLRILIRVQSAFHPWLKNLIFYLRVGASPGLWPRTAFLLICAAMLDLVKNIFVGILESRH